MFGNRIQRARKAQGLSLRELADKVGLSHTAIRKYEGDQTIPSSDILIKLAKALHVKVEYFFRPTHFELNNIQYRHLADMPSNHKMEIGCSCSTRKHSSVRQMQTCSRSSAIEAECGEFLKGLCPGVAQGATYTQQLSKNTFPEKALFVKRN